MNARQRGAIEHPTRNAEIGAVPHKNRSQRVRNRNTLLTVSEILPGTWVWHASVSYFSHDLGRLLTLGEWDEKRALKADRELRRMLEGVGEKVVFGVAPTGVELPFWKEADLQELREVLDEHATAYVDDAAGMGALLSGTPPDRFTAMHLWKTLAPAELAMVMN